MRPPVAEMDLSSNDGDSEMNDGHEPKDDFVFVNNHKYSTREERDKQLLSTMKLHHQMITLMMRLT